MSPLARSTFVLLAGCLAVGCAPGARPAAQGSGWHPVQRAGYAVDRVDTPPRLRGCSAYSEPIGHSRGDWVQLEFTVTEEGRVQPGSVREVSAHRSSSAAGNRQELQQAALTCSYEPGVHNGQPVAVRVRRSFSIP